MNFWLLISLILFSLGGVFSSQRQIQMFQQNSYYPSRYIKWVKSSFSVATVYSAMFLIITAALSFVNATHFLPIISVIEVIICVFKWYNFSKNSIKKLVYTARIKRLIFTVCTLYILLIIFSVLNLPKIINVISILLLLAFAHFTGLMVLVSNYINMPIEKSISNYYVNDSKKILAQHKDLITIGVTGSYGKTSVKFILNRILSENFNTTATPESFNTPMGIVRTVRERMKPQTEVFIAEMGAKKSGDIKELCELCHPTMGIITAVGPQHLETFGSVENVADTKFELSDEILKSEKGKIYVNFDSLPAKEIGRAHV